MLFFGGKRLHKFQKFEKLGIKAGCVVELIVNIRGGGKRARVTISDVQSKDKIPKP